MNSNESDSKKPGQTRRAILPETQLRRREGVMLRHVAGEHMLVPAVTRGVDLDSLFMLNATGVFVWEHLDGQKPVRQLCEAVAQAFSIGRDAATADVEAFLSNLLELNLTELTGNHGS